jgi:hypothetical protein
LSGALFLEGGKEGAVAFSYESSGVSIPAAADAASAAL